MRSNPITSAFTRCACSHLRTPLRRHRFRESLQDYLDERDLDLDARIDALHDLGARFSDPAEENVDLLKELMCMEPSLEVIYEGAVRMAVIQRLVEVKSSIDGLISSYGCLRAFDNFLREFPDEVDIERGRSLLRDRLGFRGGC
ncbi:uncharacterized protein L3040_005819 [Drepanopeziza brunnea f. sp. 'multigermtubi']|uniref:Uncharacterized protein n=1 Tax=Marssonina brunnea f. sp. multigermtubi (strain MB_m1) TaxID=1072389 RepID=K1W7B6_MARBU|nr:uncharacterized protein MBM_08914 [Drepanopeziza brunnea f. sp. 'multigermtubi' MB_m1]EKD12960.1 hypothetical protein MBM_08914 [Drepanopeziza brunnea f. sp. 'multigermtubi' MB_m1]KAJ5041271.1 hypothetical protein L3040_005819 [Drepanopeziza brunnea f. sp. 'multigermtubi']